MPEQGKFTLTDPLASIPIHWHDNGRGVSLRQQYLTARGIQPETRKWKRIDPDVRDNLWRRWQFKTWLSEVFAAGRLDQYRVIR